jgi:hypothetical protein
MRYNINMKIDSLDKNAEKCKEEVKSMTTLGLIVKMLTGLERIVPENYDDYQNFKIDETER